MNTNARKMIKDGDRYKRPIKKVLAALICLPVIPNRLGISTWTGLCALGDKFCFISCWMKNWINV